MNFGKVVNIEQTRYEINLVTKKNKITISTDGFARCCEKHGVKFLSGREFLKNSESNVLIYESDDEENDEESDKSNDEESDNESEKSKASYHRYSDSDDSCSKFIKIKTSGGNECVIQCYNYQNGYYSHTFTIENKHKVIHSFTL